MFGSELMVCPITTPQHKSLNMGSVKAWLPKGRWVDIFTLRSYTGEQEIVLFRDLNTIPVLARQGAIIPLSLDEGNSVDNPKSLEIWAFSGNNTFTMIEDNSKTSYAEHRAETEFSISYCDNKVTFTVKASQGDLSVIPSKRNYTVKIKDLVKDGKSIEFFIENADITQDIVFELDGIQRIKNENPHDEVIRILSRWQEKSNKKNIAYKPFENLFEIDEIKAANKKARLPKEVKLAIDEILSV